MVFKDLNLIQPLLDALKAEGYTTPTPIQQKAIPLVLDRRDVLGCAQTGTGKTAAFALPILQILKESPVSHQRKLRSLILSPTRELAIQIGESFAAYGKYTQLKHAVIFGGVPQGTQTKALQKGVDIVVATPGRLLDLLNQGFISLQHIEIFVLDEADRMLDMGFIHDIKKVLTKLPSRKQSLFFSATMGEEIRKLAGSILHDPCKVEVTPVSSAAETVKQSVYFVAKSAKRNLLIHLLKEYSIENALVFTRTKHGADRVAKNLNFAGISAEAIHGNKSQNARQRALQNFRDKKIQVLVATDIAARGIDLEKLSHVFNFELPNEPESYVHRIGRTGRAGESGTAISFCDMEEREYLRSINKLITDPVCEIEEHPFSDVEETVEVTVPGRRDSAKSGKSGKKKWFPKSSGRNPKTRR